MLTGEEGEFESEGDTAGVALPESVGELVGGVAALHHFSERDLAVAAVEADGDGIVVVVGDADVGPPVGSAADGGGCAGP